MPIRPFFEGDIRVLQIEKKLRDKINKRRENLTQKLEEVERKLDVRPDNGVVDSGKNIIADTSNSRTDSKSNDDADINKKEN